jgi:GNAT superfamily N-acetyltransferase
VQAKVAENFGLESRPAPSVYRPQASDVLAQAKAQTVSVQAQSQYELSPAVWIGQGRQQIRIRTKGSSTPIGSVDVHFKQPGKAFISDLEVAQTHRKHGLGSLLMKAALDSARRHGSTATMLEANPGPGSISKQALVSMYQKLGFKNSGVSGRGNPLMTVQGKMASLPNPRVANLKLRPDSIGIPSSNVLQRAQDPNLNQKMSEVEQEKQKIAEAMVGLREAAARTGAEIIKKDPGLEDTFQAAITCVDATFDLAAQAKKAEIRQNDAPLDWKPKNKNDPESGPNLTLRFQTIQFTKTAIEKMKANPNERRAALAELFGQVIANQPLREGNNRFTNLLLVIVSSIFNNEKLPKPEQLAIRDKNVGFSAKKIADQFLDMYK